MQNKNQEPIQQSLFDISELAQFTGTSSYYRISRRHLLTEGTKYLAERAGCFLMMDAVASHLSEIGTEDWFVMVRVQVVDSGTTSTDGVGGASTGLDSDYDVAYIQLGLKGNAVPGPFIRTG